MCFIWLALIYVIVAFTDITASTFLGRIEELDGVQVGFNPGGAVAFASVAYLSLAIVMGLWQRFGKPPLWLLTAIFVPATLGAVWLGTQFSDVLALQGPSAQKTWGAILLAYCFVASLLPVWVLLQPRGYLGGFVLYLALAVGVIGIFFGGFTVAQPAFKGFEVGGLRGRCSRSSSSPSRAAPAPASTASSAAAPRRSRSRARRIAGPSATAPCCSRRSWR